MADLDSLAVLSHELEGLALKRVGDGVDGRVVADELLHVAAGDRAVAAMALSYLLRRVSLGATPPAPQVLDAAVDAMVTALRRIPMAPPAP
jgi:hypothetical protein